jgi:hypothetical protein
MSKYKEIVDELVESIDEETREDIRENERRGRKQHDLVLLGDPESPFFRGLRRKAEKLGIPVHLGESADGQPAYVLDRETYKRYPPFLGNDIDGGDDMTAVSEGVLETILRGKYCYDLPGRDVCIVGRGPAVKGLADKLLIADYTVTVCHSKTGFKALAEHLDRAEIVVLGTPELPAGMTFSGAELIIDIGGAVDSAFAEACQNYLGPRDIGRLCTSILCNRAAQSYLITRGPHEAPASGEGICNGTL